MSRIRGLFHAAIIGLFAMAVFGAPVSAADDAASVISYRQKVMSAIGAHMGSIGAVLKGEVSFRWRRFMTTARARMRHG